VGRKFLGQADVSRENEKSSLAKKKFPGENGENWLPACGFPPVLRDSFHIPDVFFTIYMKELEWNAVLAYDHT
jgi:hypothetical protein